MCFFSNRSSKGKLPIADFAVALSDFFLVMFFVAKIVGWAARSNELWTTKSDCSR